MHVEVNVEDPVAVSEMTKLSIACNYEASKTQSKMTFEPACLIGNIVEPAEVLSARST